MFLHPQLLAFDAPSRKSVLPHACDQTTRRQHWFWLNDPTFVEAARNLAERVMAELDGDQGTLALLWRLAVSRRPDADEQKLLTDLLERRRLEYKDSQSWQKNFFLLVSHRLIPNWISLNEQHGQPQHEWYSIFVRQLVGTRKR